MDYRRLMNQVVMGTAVPILVSAALADTIHVDDDNCPGPGSGSEDNPYCSIQTALDNALSTDEIVVAVGVYYETINFLGKAVTLRSTDPGDPGVVAGTIIDGAGYYHVVQCVSSEGSATVLDGFTITGGAATGFSFPNSAGGGMYSGNGSPTVTNCTFEGNTAYYGGGMYSYQGNPTVTNCIFAGNSAGASGGGMYGSIGNTTVIGCTFDENSADWGGGMMAANGDHTVTDCTFNDNEADYGGGMYHANGSSSTVTNCTFNGNSAVTLGGGIYNDSTPTVIDSAFCGNSPDHIDGQAVLQGQIDMSAHCPIPVCQSDSNGDGEVNVSDFLLMLGNWGSCP